MVSLRNHLQSHEKDLPTTSLGATPSTTHPIPLSNDPNTAHPIPLPNHPNDAHHTLPAREAIPPSEDNPNPQPSKTTQDGSAYANQEEYLRDLFPQVPHSRIAEVSRRFLISDAIDHLVQWNDTYVSMSLNNPIVSPTIDLTCTTEDTSGPASTCGLSPQTAILIPTIAPANCSPRVVLEQHAARVIDSTADTTIEVSRDNVWRKAKGFYKSCLHESQRVRLRRSLHIEFEGEEGIDAGALKAEFFSTVLKSLNEELFEGDHARRVPKCDWENVQMMEIAGMMISHSILQGGPGFPCLAPVVVDHLLTESAESLTEVPFLQDVPLTAATGDLVDLIKKVSFICCSLGGVALYVYHQQTRH